MLLANVEAEYTDAETWPRNYLQSLFFCKIRESNQQQQTPTPTDTHTQYKLKALFIWHNSTLSVTTY